LILACWIQTDGDNDYEHEYDQFGLTALNQCKAACVKNYTCVAVVVWMIVDGKLFCSMETSTDTPLTSTLIIARYELKRSCPQS